MHTKSNRSAAKAGVRQLTTTFKDGQHATLKTGVQHGRCWASKVAHQRDVWRVFEQCTIHSFAEVARDLYFSVRGIAITHGRDDRFQDFWEVLFGDDAETAQRDHLMRRGFVQGVFHACKARGKTG